MEMPSWTQRLQATVEGRLLLEEERILLEATESLSRLMEEQGIPKAELARRLGVSPAYVTKLLGGSNNFTLRTIARAFYALGRSLHIEHGPAGDRIRVPSGMVHFIDLPVGRWSAPSAWDVRYHGERDARHTTPCDAGAMRPPLTIAA